MTEKMTARERWAAADAAQAETTWGMQMAPDPRGNVTPDELARQAYDRGDQLFQIDMPVSVIQGWAQVGMSGSRAWRPEPYDMLGAIERVGWRLEHVTSTYVINGSTSTKRVMASTGASEVAYHGAMVGLYVFRRRVDDHGDSPAEVSSLG